jgi:hypothetical protein
MKLKFSQLEDLNFPQDFKTFLPPARQIKSRQMNFYGLFSRCFVGVGEEVGAIQWMHN